MIARSALGRWYHGTRKNWRRPVIGLSVAFVALLAVVDWSPRIPEFHVSAILEPLAQRDAGTEQPRVADTVRASPGDERKFRVLAEFLSRKYKVSQDAIFDLVGLAHATGRQIGLDPLLIIAVISVESRFNPIAESVAGAKGLMQVIPRFHVDKLRSHGGEDTVFDPETNIRVGTQILKEYLTRTGNLSMALQMYAGALSDDNDAYTNRVLGEKYRLQQIVGRAAPKGTQEGPVRTAERKRPVTRDPGVEL
jgi:soluble lytic murein transglycosylase-like protein